MAFLRSPIGDDVHLEQPQICEPWSDDDKLVHWLIRSVYGVKKVANNWQILISDVKKVLEAKFYMEGRRDYNFFWA